MRRLTVTCDRPRHACVQRLATAAALTLTTTTMTTMTTIIGCGDDAGSSGTAGLSVGATSVGPGGTTLEPSGSGGQTTGAPTSGETGTSLSSGPDTTSTSGGPGSSGPGSSGETSASSTSGDIKLDVGDESTTGAVECPDNMGMDVEFSYIWISNTGESTLSKLNTQTLVEEGRYVTRADQNGSPSRTSVNLSGDVVVANRNGGVSKFFARADDCPETNGQAGLQTSSGADDVLAWDLEECRAWFTQLDGTSNRPIAWTSGVLNEQSCEWEQQKVWTSTSVLGQPGSMQVHRLDGETGAVENTVDLPQVDLGSWGAYGGAVDADNDFWMTTHGSGNPPTLVRVRYGDLSVSTWSAPPGVSPYGITVDVNGRPWIAGYAGGVARFDPETETWAVVDTVTGLGLQADGEGRVWVGSYPNKGATSIDIETLAVLDYIAIPDAQVTKGVSIDFFGYVWVVSMDTRAYRIDPDTHLYDTYSGLNQAYTYSDMTGWGLKNVQIPQ